MKWMLVPRGERIVYYLQRGAVGAMHAYGCKLEPYTSMGSLPSHAAVFADQLLRLHPVAPHFQEESGSYLSNRYMPKQSYTAWYPTRRWLTDTVMERKWRRSPIATGNGPGTERTAGGKYAASENRAILREHLPFPSLKYAIADQVYLEPIGEHEHLGFIVVRRFAPHWPHPSLFLETPLSKIGGALLFGELKSWGIDLKG